jgi:hypothetical protein
MWTTDTLQRLANQPVAAYLPPSGNSRNQKKMGGARKRKPSTDIIICYSINLLVSTILEIVLYRLSVNLLVAELLVGVFMLLFPLGYALAEGNRILFGLTCSVIVLAAMFALPAHSLILFIIFYTSFLVLSVLVALTVRITGK